MTRAKLSPIRLEGFQPLREMVFDVLMDAIMSGQLPPGERLMEVQLAEEMGVSRTPVREAIRRLELEGFVVMIPRKGAYVAGLSIKDIVNIFEIRTALEQLAVGLAAERMTSDDLEALERMVVELSESAEEADVEAWTELDKKFHQLIYEYSRNDRLIQMMNNIIEQINRYRIISLSNPEVRLHSIEEHKKIVEAMAERDIPAAEKAARDHLANTQTSLIVLLQEKLSGLE
ncbi:MAG: GntR family transcriptional regulator [Bacillota bacterium]|jgi:DNA-binding GntR family transcriptional regulator